MGFFVGAPFEARDQKRDCVRLNRHRVVGAIASSFPSQPERKWR